MIRLFVTGGSGTLGTDFQRVASSEPYLGEFEWVAPSSADFDVTNPESAAQLAHRQFGEFDWVLNFAAYTAVDQAESDREACYGLNAFAPAWLARASTDLGARFLHISTDCVFDGEKGVPYSEEDLPNPIQIYGESKWQGEIAVREANADAIILRTSWLHGSTGKSFPGIIKQKLLNGEPIRAVRDQFGTPTHASELSNWILRAIQMNLTSGTYHAAGSEVESRYTWALKIAEKLIAQKMLQEVEIEPVLSSSFPTIAPRPRNSALSSFNLRQLVPVD